MIEAKWELSAGEWDFYWDVLGRFGSLPQAHSVANSLSKLLIGDIVQTGGYLSIKDHCVNFASNRVNISWRGDWNDAGKLSFVPNTVKFNEYYNVPLNFYLSTRLSSCNLQWEFYQSRQPSVFFKKNDRSKLFTVSTLIPEVVKELEYSTFITNEYDFRSWLKAEYHRLIQIKYQRGEMGLPCCYDEEKGVYQVLLQKPANNGSIEASEPRYYLEWSDGDSKDIKLVWDFGDKSTIYSVGHSNFLRFHLAGFCESDPSMGIRELRDRIFDLDFSDYQRMFISVIENSELLGYTVQINNGCTIIGKFRSVHINPFEAGTIWEHEDYPGQFCSIAWNLESILAMLFREQNFQLEARGLSDKISLLEEIVARNLSRVWFSSLPNSDCILNFDFSVEKAGESVGKIRYEVKYRTTSGTVLDWQGNEHGSRLSIYIPDEQYQGCHHRELIQLVDKYPQK